MSSNDFARGKDLQGVLILVVTAALTIVGDYFIKLASQEEDGLMSRNFIIGAILYGLPAFGWYFLMRHSSLAALGIFYSASTIILLAAMGFVVFREPFGMREAIGIALAVASVVVISWGR